MAQAYVYEDNATGWRLINDLDLPLSGVTSGTYGDATHTAQVTVDDRGLVTAAASVPITAAGGITQLTGDVTAGPGSGTQAATLASSGVSAGTYGDTTHVAQVTVDAKGRVTGASNQPIATGAGAVTWPVVQTIFELDSATGGSTVQTNNIKLVRCLIPFAGTLDSLAVFNTVQSGNISLSVYDTGQASGTVITRLATSGAVAAGTANAWQSFNPGISVTAAQQVLFGVSCDNNTYQVNSATTLNAAASLSPSSFGTPVASTVLCVLVGSSHPAPATIAAASLTVGNIHPPIFVAHIT